MSISSAKRDKILELLSTREYDFVVQGLELLGALVSTKEGLYQFFELPAVWNKSYELQNGLSAFPYRNAIYIWILARLIELEDERVLNLTELSLSRIGLENSDEIHLKSFSKLSKLTDVTLAQNSFQSIPNFVETILHLEHLDLSRNSITSLPEWVCRVSTLKYLNLSDNPLTTLPNNIDCLTNLQTLELANCDLHTLPPSFDSFITEVGLNETTHNPYWKSQCLRRYSLPGIVTKRILQLLLDQLLAQEQSVERLNLYGFDLTDLPADIVRLTQLTELNLECNKLKRLPADFCALTRLRHLKLRHNKLTSLPEEIGQLSQLQYLSLHHNELRRLPDGFCSLTGLKQLLLFKNHLNTLPENIGNLTQVTNIKLGSNHLTVLPDSMQEMTQIQQINLSRNGFKYLPKQMDAWVLLQRFLIDNNRVQTIQDFTEPNRPDLTRLTQLHYFSMLDEFDYRTPDRRDLKENIRSKMPKDLFIAFN